MTACNGDHQKVMIISGSSTIYPINKMIAEQYSDSDFRLVIGESGTSAGFQKLLNGQVNINCASRSINESEKSAFESKGIDLLEIKIGYDGVVVVVNPKNDWIDSIDLNTLKKIWQPSAKGVILKWSDIDPKFPNIPLKLYAPGNSSGTFDFFTKVVNGKSRSSRTDFSPNESDNFLVSAVASDKYSLGYFGLSYYLSNVDKIKALKIIESDNTQTPSVQALIDNQYSIFKRPLYLYIDKKALADEKVTQFLKNYLDFSYKHMVEIGFAPLTLVDYQSQIEELKIHSQPFIPQ